MYSRLVCPLVLLNEKDEGVAVAVKKLLLADGEKDTALNVEIEVRVECLASIPVPFVDLTQFQIESRGQLLHSVLGPVRVLFELSLQYFDLIF